ncbi:MAG TPA: hypothetical protein PKC72_13930 [Chitinophagaceae bacterium]|nr:hypothetical protein [Chitinophagaceae bacterium]
MKVRIEEMLRMEGNEEFLEQFVFSKSEFQQLEFEDDGREFELNGKMYDIVKIREGKDKNIIYCINDEKETGLKDLAKKNNTQKEKKLKNTISKIYISQPFLVLSGYSIRSEHFIPRFMENIKSLSYEVLKPPPRSC